MRAIARVAAALLLGAAACSARHTTLPPEPGVTLAAHRDADDLVIDRLPDGASGVLVRRGRLHAEGAPELALQVAGETRAGIWIVGRSRVLVREGPSNRAPLLGEVLSDWDGRAIRLTLYGRDRVPLRTDVFQHTDREPGAAALALDESGDTDLQGSYRATVRDAHEASVGWMRVQIRPTEGVSRLYDAVLPPAVDGALAAGAAVALDAEVDRMLAQRNRSETTVAPMETTAAVTPRTTLATASKPRPARPCVPSEMR